MSWRYIKSQGRKLRKRLWRRKYSTYLVGGGLFVVLLVLGVAFLGHDTPPVAMVPAESLSSEINIAESSPLGASGGLVVPASCPSDLHDEPNYGQPCTGPANRCGMTYAGTIQCGGSCSAGAPADSLCNKPTGLWRAFNDDCSWVNLGWNASPGAERYAVRLDDWSNNSWPGCSWGWYCPSTYDYTEDAWGATDIWRPISRNQGYGWWVHSRTGNGWSDPEGSTFSCNLPMGDVWGGNYVSADCSGGIWGWACDKDNPNASIDVHVYNGAPGDYSKGLGSVTANLDGGAPVGAVCGGGSNYHVYTFPIPVSMRTGTNQQLTFYGINNPATGNQHSSIGSKWINCPVPTVNVYFP